MSLINFLFSHFNLVVGQTLPYYGYSTPFVSFDEGSTRRILLYIHSSGKYDTMFTEWDPEGVGTQYFLINRNQAFNCRDRVKTFGIPISTKVVKCEKKLGSAKNKDSKFNLILYLKKQQKKREREK